jgi:hypothetical protein
MSKSANSSSLSPLESVWLYYQRLLNSSEKRRKKSKAYEAVYWIGYQRAIRDIGTAITNEIFKDLIQRFHLGGESLAKQPAGVQSESDLQQMQKL